MIEQLNKYKTKNAIVFLPKNCTYLEDSITYTLKNVINFDKEKEDNQIIDIINNSKIKKIYLLGNNDIYRYILPIIFVATKRNLTLE